MALPSVLSDKGLAKFRTKLCERLLATGTCVFSDKCQYSHTERPRRNPQKIRYAAQRCANADTCELGTSCPFAHTRDEELYHPSTYKTTMCRGGHECGGYYCSMAHHGEELRPGHPGASMAHVTAPTGRTYVSPATQVEGGTGGTPCVEVEDTGRVEEAAVEMVASQNSARRSQANLPPRTIDHSDINSLEDRNTSVSSASSGSGPGLLQSLTGVDSWWYAGDQLDLRVCVREVTPSPAGDGDALLGGILRPGIFSGKSQFGRQQDREVRCQVKLLTISRADSGIAAQVVKEAKRWIGHASDGDKQSALVLRRTVATTVLALPEWASTLGQSLRKMKESPARQAAAEWRMVMVLATWARQLVSQVSNLHGDSISHLCLGPQTITVDARGDLHVGDFMGKIRALCLFETGWKGKPDESWAMWYPAEVHRRLSSKDQHVESSINCYAVDSWQLGVCLFYTLTGEHPFGNRCDPSVVCANIVADRRVNRPLLDHLPLFADLVGRLTERHPEQRLPPRQACKHPVLWTFEEASRFVSPILPIAETTKRFSALWAWLQHIPPLAAYGSPTAPVDTGCKGEHDFLTFVCDKSLGLKGGWLSSEVEQIDLSSLAVHALAFVSIPATAARVHQSTPVPAVLSPTAQKSSAAETKPALMPLPLLPRTAQDVSSLGSSSPGSPTMLAEVMAAPPGLEEFAGNRSLPAPAVSNHADMPLLGTEPRPFVSGPSSAITSISHTSPSLLQGPPHSLTSTRPRHSDASEGRRGVTGLSDGNLGLVHATGHNAEINHLFSPLGLQPSLLDYNVPPFFGGSEAVRAHYQQGVPYQPCLPYLQLPGYLQNLSRAQQVALEQQQQHEAWVRHCSLLQSYAHSHYLGLSGSLPDSLLIPGTPAAPYYENVQRESAVSPWLSTPPHRVVYNASMDPSLTPVKHLRQAPASHTSPLAAVDVLTLLENGVSPGPSAFEGRTDSSVRCQLARLPEMNAERSVDPQVVDSIQAGAITTGNSDPSQDIDCLPEDLLQAMETQSGRIHRSV